MDDKKINELIEKLNAIQKNLINHDEEVRGGMLDMEVSEWNQTPLGKAVGDIGDVIEALEGDDDDYENEPEDQPA